MSRIIALPAGDGFADDAVELRVADDVTVGGEGAPVYLLGIYLRATAIEVWEIHVRLDHDDPGLVGYAGHIGFEVAPEHRGHRYALRAVRLVAPLGRRHGFSALWLTTSPENGASRRTIELLGARYVDTVDVPARSDMRKLGLVRVRRYCWEL